MYTQQITLYIPEDSINGEWVYSGLDQRWVPQSMASSFKRFSMKTQFLPKTSLICIQHDCIK
jgi:hypothetical protein